MKLNPPSFVSKEKSYERWKTEVKAWEMVTDVPQAKRGIAVALSLPENDSSRVREQVFEEISIDDLGKDDGLKTLLKFMDSKLGKDDMEDSLEKYEEFKNCKRTKNQKITDFILEFEQRYNRMAKKDITLPQEILAFELLSNANISKQDKMLVLTGIDFSKKSTLFEQAKRSLKKFKGEQAGGSGDVAAMGQAIKLEPAFLAENEEALAAAGYYRQRNRATFVRPVFGTSRRGSYRGRGGGRGFIRHSGTEGDQNNLKQSPKQEDINPEKPLNPLNTRDVSGQLKTCYNCGSYRHMVADCPHTWENMRKNKVYYVEEQVVMYTGYNQDEIQRLGNESRNCAVLDTACTSTVCGDKWLQCFLDTLTEEQLQKVEEFPGRKLFKFGGGECLKSTKCLLLPCYLAGKEILINVDVVHSDIPMLLSLESLKKAKVKLDLENDEAEILGSKVSLNFTSSGHYCVPVDQMEDTRVEEVYQVRLDQLDDRERYKALIKLHKQFLHPPKKRFVSLMKDADVWKQEFVCDIDKLYEECQTCRRFAKTPARPVVGLPMANKFNDRVALDLKIWKGGKYILHMIDMFSRLSVSVFIARKHPREVVDKIMRYWVAAGWGVMKSVLFDNGGEFSNNEMREVASILNVETCTTPSESPWSNSLCERNHQITDRMLEILEEENSDTDLDTLLAWANLAKNSLQMWNGFSSYQLVLGQNPNLPNMMTDGLPALQGATSSQALEKHLNALHTARKAFIQCEADEKIRRALRHQVRAAEDHFESGEMVYYKRCGSKQWLGPGRVIFQDGRLVFVRHGGVYVRVSTNRLIKCGKEFGHKELEDEQADVSDGDNVGDGVICDVGIDGDFGVSGDYVDDEVVCEDIGVNGVNGDNVAAGGVVHENIGADGGDGNSGGSEIFDNGVNGARDGGVGKNLGITDHYGEGVVEGEGDGESVSEGEGCEGASKGEGGGKDHTKVTLKKNDVIHFKVDKEDKWTIATVLGRAGKSTSKNKSWYNVRDQETGKSRSVDLEKVQEWRKNENVNLVLIPKSRHSEEECVKAKKVELEKLKHFGVYQEVDDEGQESISTTWVLWMKGDEARARIVARGFEEDVELNKDSPTVAKSTMRILLTIAALNTWTIQTTDIKSAFLQGKDIKRDVFIIPPKESDTPRGKLWKLKKTLYGLMDAARQFYDSVEEALLKLGMIQSKVDPALFYMREKGKLIGALVTHIDDFMHCGEDSFNDIVMAKLRRLFVAGKMEKGEFKYVGFDIRQNPDGIILDQSHYSRQLEGIIIKPQRAKQKKELLDQEESSLFRGIVGKLNWVAQGTRPDVSFEVVEMSSRFKLATVNDLIRANKCILKLKEEPVYVFFPNLGDPKYWRMIIESDAGHANMEDGCSSAGGQLIMLAGERDKCCVLAWSSNKIKRVVKSTLAAEMLSLSDALDYAIYLRYIVMELTALEKGEVPISAYVDNKSVVDALHSTKAVEDKRLRIDIGAIKQLMKRKEVASIQWIPGKMMLANVLTKRGAASFDILELLQSGSFNLHR